MCLWINLFESERIHIYFTVYLGVNVLTVRAINVRISLRRQSYKNGMGERSSNCPPGPQTVMKLIYYLPVQLPCTIQGAWQFPPCHCNSMTFAHSLSSLTPTGSSISAKLRQRGGKWEWRHRQGKSRRGGMDYPLCLKAWPKHLAQGLFISWSWKTPSGARRH